MNRLGAWRLPDLTAPLAAATAVLCAALFLPQVLNDGDTYTHLAAGLWMLAHGAMIRADPFSYTFAGRPWQAHEWLSELLMGLAYRLAGWSGVVLLAGAAAALAAGLLAYHLGRWLKGLSLALVLVLSLSCLAPSLLVRPHVLALPCLELWAAGLVLARRAGRPPSWLLIPVMIVWANLHGGFLFGLVLVVPFALEAALSAAPDARLKTAGSWALFGGVAAVAAMISPHGADNLLLPIRLLGMTGLSAIGEWKSATFERVTPFEIAILAGLYVFLSRGVRLPWIRLLVLLGLVHLSLQHVRHQVLFGIVAPLVLAAPMAAAFEGDSSDGQPREPARPRGLIVAAGLSLLICGLMLARLSAPIVRVDGQNSPVSALAHVPAPLAAQPVFNDYGFGGYLAFRGVKPFIDGRAELYGDGFLSVYDAMSQARLCALRANFDRYGVNWTLLDPRSPVVSLLDVAPGWRRLYADPVAVVQVYDPASNPGVSRIPGPPCPT